MKENMDAELEFNKLQNDLSKVFCYSLSFF